MIMLVILLSVIGFVFFYMFKQISELKEQQVVLSQQIEDSINEIERMKNVIISNKH